MQLGYLLTVASEQVAGKDELLEQNNLEFVVRTMRRMIIIVNDLPPFAPQFESNNLFHFKSDKTRG